MPFEIEYGHPAGYAPVDVAPGEYFWAIVSEFVSSEDGEPFMKRLDGIPSEVIVKLPAEARLPYSMIDHMLVIFHPDGKATVYINELNLQILAQASRSIAPGQLVRNNDIAQIVRLKFPDEVSIPNDCGVLYLFSIGWRKGLYYDFGPVNGPKRESDLGKLLGGFYSYLNFQRLFNITDIEWEVLSKLGWFPFVRLQQNTISQIMWCARTGKRTDELTEIAASDFDSRLEEHLQSWRTNPLAATQLPFLEEAVKHYSKGEYMAVCAIIYPRIEGLMRTYHQAQGLTSNQSQRNLADAVVCAHVAQSHGFSRLLPERFKAYLEGVFFRGFNPTDVIEDLNRNTVGHGVAPAKQFDKKGAIIGLLTVDQILFFGNPVPSEETAKAAYG